jgi:hypothetical protein
MNAMMRSAVDGRSWHVEGPQRSAGRRTWAATAWLVAGTIAVAVTSYTLSLQVASERREVEQLARKNRSLQSDLKALDAELRVRMRMPQLQRWNDSVLGLVPISATQYLANPVQLASYGTAPAAPVAPQQPRVQLAVRDLPAAQAPSAAQPVLVKAEVPMAPATAGLPARPAPQQVVSRPAPQQVASRPAPQQVVVRPASVPAIARPAPETAPADLLQQVEMSFGGQQPPQR